MAEKFMTRRERREAERRQADAAYDAQQAPEAEAAAPAKPAAPAQPAPPAQPAAPEKPAAPARSAQDAPAQPAPAAPPAPTAPPTAPPAPTDPPAAAELTEPPHFATRGERKRFLRENDLPADIPTASIPIVLAQRAAGIETDSADTADSADAAPAAEAPASTPDAAPTASQHAPSGDAEGDSDSTQATSPSSTESATPETTEPSTQTSPQASGRSGSLFGSDDPVTVTTAPSAEPAAEPSGGLGSLFDDTSAQSPTGSPTASTATGRTGAVTTGSGAPQFDLASRRVGSHATGPDFETSSTAVITPSALGDHDAPLKRRSPVVKPPTGSNIRVVTGALPIVQESDLEANPPTTPMSAIDESAATGGSRGTDTFRTSESPVFRTSRPAADPWSRLGQEDEEEDSDELEEPPARPMSARSVTNEDGSVLVAERNSMVPYIVLGVTGFAALILVIVAITLLF